MSERAKRIIGSMFGMHIQKLPSVEHECAAFEYRSDKASCAMCQVMHVKGVWPGHWDLKEQLVQETIQALFMDKIKEDFSSYSCPFPETDTCHTLMQRRRPR